MQPLYMCVCVYIYRCDSFERSHSPEMSLKPAAALLLLLTAHFVLSAPIIHANGPPSGFIQVDPTSRQFVDASGRSLLFHGSSIVYKVARHPAETAVHVTSLTPLHPVAGGAVRPRHERV